MNVLRPKDEHWHEPTPARHFNESFYFNAFDTDSGWAVATRIGATPGAGDRDGFVCLYFPDGSTGFVETEQPIGHGVDRIRAGALEYICVKPFEKWRVRYDGPLHYFTDPATVDDLERTRDSSRPTRHVVLDLDVTPVHPAFDYHKRSVVLRSVGDLARSASSRSPFATLRRIAYAARMLPSMIGAHHYEHATRVGGSIVIDGQASRLEGYGQRDHSWGVRDMNVPVRWRWLSCQFAEQLCFNAVQVDVLAMRVQSGFVLRRGSPEPITRWRFETVEKTHRYWPDRFEATLETEIGPPVTVLAEVTSPLPVVARTPSRGTLVTAARAQYRWGEHTADGMVECMEQLR